MMDNHDDVSMVVGVFRARARAQAAIEALVRSGVAPEAIRLVEPNPGDADLLVELTEADQTEWEQEFENLEGTLVIVSDSRRDQVRALLVDHGAEIVAADSDPMSAIPVTEPNVSGSGVSTPVIAKRLRPNMFVVGSDYTLIGRIKRVEGRELLLDRRPMLRDVWVAMTSVKQLIGDWVVLTMPADQVNPMEPYIQPRIGERTNRPDQADDEGRA